ncbi:hypothetical protein LPJ78_002104 [Coemansia sp. RSA 989]|nr:hypothetical protein BX667DRAFT_498724 [Coemansia mojavensis]KAJ1741661.1 hypothetical protein LPJ68_002626 [Coemansia sp. RSA 1086]KAJ1751585.1 hypothetical protein LPJ79_001959 [Coemansia sp. RSA 1821]KAJ1866105.1 hypothetical protein LPJ78_002104 [Coemansia sp. RSA 989]KAJ1875996.1 hypothetical protein LPJ55_000176 [Coemansia sp. RSA 990]KAJ2674103.1 hypothetical protein IWW42_001923 [Coemansia sp. RSA 1085]
MLRRLTRSTLRTRSVQQCSARLYSSENGSNSPPKATEKTSETTTTKPTEDKAQGSDWHKLMDSFKPKPQSSFKSSIGKFSNLLNENKSDQLLKQDFMGFSKAGRYGGIADLGKNDKADPMSKLILHVHASSNNTILSLTDAKGRVIVNASGGTVGFKKAQRAGFEAAYQATASIANTVKERNIPVRMVEIRFKGFGAGRDAAFKAVNSLTNWTVCAVSDVTPVPFNGCRPKKARRL